MPMTAVVGSPPAIASGFSARSRAGPVVYLVDFKVERQRYIVTNQLEVGLRQQVSHVGFLACEEVVDTNDIVFGFHESFA